MRAKGKRSKCQTGGLKYPKTQPLAQPQPVVNPIFFQFTGDPVNPYVPVSIPGTYTTSYDGPPNKQKSKDKIYEKELGGLADSGIEIKPSHKGLFTQKAKDHGMSVQAFANRVLANKEDYPPSTVKQANFAHVFGGRNFEVGGIYDLLENQIQELIEHGYTIEYV